MLEEEIKINDLKTLLIFDFDNTIINGYSDERVLRLIENEELVNKVLSEGRESWADLMQQGFLQMKQEKKTLKSVKEIIENLEFNEYFNELFEYIKIYSNFYEIIIISGANTLYLKWFLEKNKLYSLVNEYFALNAKEDEEHLIKITNCHQHDCLFCNIAQCKQKIIREYLIGKQYKKVIYIGDGYNDFCVAKVLKENDYLLPRKDYTLYKLLNDPIKKDYIKCNVMSWKNGRNIINILKSI